MDFQSLPVWSNALIFCTCAAMVWAAGWRLSAYVDRISEITRIGRAFAGLIMLGAITTLPEIGNAVTAATIGNPALAVNSILGSVSVNFLLLALADAVLGAGALTALVARPTTLLQATFGIILLATAAAGVAAGEIPVGSMGAVSLIIVPVFLVAVRLTSQFENRRTWEPSLGPRPERAQTPSAASAPPKGLVLRTAVAAAVILGAGIVLANAADALANQSGIGSNLIGFVLVGLATSLPDASSLVSSAQRQSYELILGQVFGASIFALMLIPVADAVYRGGPILAEGGTFEIVAALLGILLTAIFVVGLLERRDRTFLRMGYDSIAVLCAYAVGVTILWRVSGA